MHSIDKPPKRMVKFTPKLPTINEGEILTFETLSKYQIQDSWKDNVVITIETQKCAFCLRDLKLQLRRSQKSSCKHQFCDHCMNKHGLKKPNKILGNFVSGCPLCFDDTEQTQLEKIIWKLFAVLIVIGFLLIAIS